MGMQNDKPGAGDYHYTNSCIVLQDGSFYTVYPGVGRFFHYGGDASEFKKAGYFLNARTGQMVTYAEWRQSGDVIIEDSRKRPEPVAALGESARNNKRYAVYLQSLQHV
jgi:hypothetical protein